jgi:GT2 family glycosyltransferase
MLPYSRKPETSQMTTSVASVTTAHNAAQVLPRQIEALLGQSLPLQEIVVVDDQSGDGTSRMLAERYPQVRVIRTAENVGAAGAWSRGLAYAAIERRHDWVWTLDQDSVPPRNALETLLAGSASVDAGGGEVGIVTALPVHWETQTCYPPLLWREGFVKPSAEELHQPIWFADLVIASGLMVRRELVEKIGLPRADFFMDLADFEYCLRARSAGYRIAVVTGVRLSHEIGHARPVRLPGYAALWPDHAPWREYYMSRNLAYVAWWLYPSGPTKRSVVRHMLRHAVGSVLFGSEKLACVKKMVQGFSDGRRARLGIRFLPGPSPVSRMAAARGLGNRVVGQEPQ